MFNTLWKVEGRAGGDDFKIALSGDAAGYLMNETGYSLKRQQEKSLSEAIQNPESFITKREAALAKIYDDKVQPAFLQAAQELAPLGLPEDVFKAMVLKRADNKLQEELEVHNLRFPGYDAALGKQQGKRDLMEERNFNESGGISKAERKAIKAKAVAKYKSQRKAKRAAKSS